MAKFTVTYTVSSETITRNAVDSMRMFPGRKLKLCCGSRDTVLTHSLDVSKGSAASLVVGPTGSAHGKRETLKTACSSDVSCSAAFMRGKATDDMSSLTGKDGLLGSTKQADGFCVRDSFKFLFPQLACVDSIPMWSSWGVCIAACEKYVNFLKPSKWGWPVDISCPGLPFMDVRNTLLKYCSTGRFIFQVCIATPTDGENSLHCIPLCEDAFEQTTIVRVIRAYQVCLK